jgi:hypothetical protein
MNSPSFAFDPNSIDSVNAMLQSNLPDTTVVPEPEPAEAGPVPEVVDTGMSPHAKAAVDKGFHIFPLAPKSKVPPRGSHGFQDSRAPSDPLVLEPWNQESNYNIGLDLGASNRTVLDFDKLESIPDWINAIRTFKVGTSRGVHVHFSGSRSSTGLFIDGVKVGDLQSIGKYVLAAGCVHPSGAKYTVIDDSPIIPLPDVSSLVKRESERVNASTDGPPIPHGHHDSELFRIGCMLRNAGMGYEQIKDNLVEICEKRCVDHGSDYVDMCERKAAQAAKYQVGKAGVRAVLGKAEPAKGSNSETNGRTLRFVRGDSIVAKRLSWLWPGRILADKLNVFSGEPGVGKGMTTVDLAARLTRHLDFPDGKNELDGPKDVVFLSSEDDMEDTIVPRLIVAGADMKRIHFAQISENSTGTLEEGIVCLDRDLPRLEEMVKRNPDIVLIIPDPIIAFLGDADANKDKDVRPIYSKMKTFAKRLSVAWLFINHWNKNQTASSINRTSGAKTMVSAPRATWMFGVSPEDPTKYLMMKGKGNLTGNSTKTLSYTIEGIPYDFQDGLPVDPNGVPRLIWAGETEHNTEDVLRDQNDPKLHRNVKAEELLVKLLKDGAMLARDVYREGDKEKLDDNQMKRARYKLGYVVKPIDKVWYWAKSEEDILIKKERLFTPRPITLDPGPADVDLGPVN